MKIKEKGHAGKSKSHDEWIYGLNPVLEAIKSGRKIKSVLISSSRRDLPQFLEAEIPARGLKLERAENSFFDRNFPKGHQGIAALCESREYKSPEELAGIPAERNERPLFLILDCLEDPRNFGAILRIADAGGVHGVFIQGHRSVSLTPEAVKASAGASEYVPISMVPNIKNIMREMKKEGITVMGAEAGTGKTIWDVDLTVPLALVIGSEGRGLRKTVREECDLLFSLPMSGRVNSLNASVATGIIIFEAGRQRQIS